MFEKKLKNLRRNSHGGAEGKRANAPHEVYANLTNNT